MSIDRQVDRDPPEVSHWRIEPVETHTLQQLKTRPNLTRPKLMRQHHRRYGFAGSIHFITVVTRVRGLIFVEDSICRRILECFEYHRRKQALDCYGYVLMPDHIHALLVQKGDGFPVIEMMRGFKSWTSRSASFKMTRNSPLWRTHYDDVPVPGTDAMVTKIDYIHYNPVRRGLVQGPMDYAWSSANDIYADRVGMVTICRL